MTVRQAVGVGVGVGVPLLAGNELDQAGDTSAVRASTTAATIMGVGGLGLWWADRERHMNVPFADDLFWVGMGSLVTNAVLLTRPTGPRLGLPSGF